MELLSKYFLYFIIYSFIGWLLEVVCKLIEQKKFVNRGFLIGPICPIYGYGVLGIILLIGDNKDDILAIFLKSIAICSCLEYFTSYLMEKLFKARWWDYSRYKYNINGRICLETMIPFGILGCFTIYIVHPAIVNLVSLLDSKLMITLAVILFIIYIIDNIISFNVMNKIKKEIKSQHEDSTEKIKSKVIEWMDSNSFIYRHIKKSFPKFKINESKIR